MDTRDGCLSGIVKLLALTWLFDWLQKNFGFGRGCSIGGCGCGFVLLILFFVLACGVFAGTDWLSLRF